MMLQELSASVRRLAGLPVNNPSQARHPLVRVGEGGDESIAVAHSDIASLRGVTPSAADTNECTCPEPCERDHANE